MLCRGDNILAESESAGAEWPNTANYAGRIIAVMVCCGDESADETKERVFAVAGIVGLEEQWQELENRWIDRCSGIPFHGNDCDSDQGDFAPKPDEDADKRHKANKALYKDLSILLAESGLGGMGIMLDLSAQNKVFPQSPGGMPYYKCFVELLARMQRCASHNNETVKFIFDMRTEGQYNTGVLYALSNASEARKEQLHSEISFACSKTNPRIQVADLWARESMKEIDNHIGPVKRPTRKSMECLSNTGRFHIDCYSEEWFVDLKKNLPELGRQTHMSMADYARWLRTTNRNVDNMSNRIAYIQYVIARDGD